MCAVSPSTCMDRIGSSSGTYHPASMGALVAENCPWHKSMAREIFGSARLFI
jgi:hypothetical protein